MRKGCQVLPSLLSANFVKLNDQLKEMKEAGIKKVHYDVMDGHFVSSITFGEKIFQQINNSGYDFDIDVHLMVTNPFQKTRDFALAGAKKISFHIEILDEDVETSKLELKKLREEFKDVQLGLAINPATKIEDVDKWIDLFDYFLIMSVVPGKGGQAYIEGSEKKIKYLDDYRKKNKKDFFIEVDGGINDETSKLCLESGVDYLVCGSYFFNASNKKEIISKILK